MNKELCELLGDNTPLNSDREFRYVIWDGDSYDNKIKKCKYAIIRFRHDIFVKDSGIDELNLLTRGLNIDNDFLIIDADFQHETYIFSVDKSFYKVKISDNDIVCVNDITCEYRKQALDKFRDTQFYKSWDAQFE